MWSCVLFDLVSVIVKKKIIGVMFESVCLLVDGKIRLLNTVKVLWIHE